MGGDLRLDVEARRGQVTRGRHVAVHHLVARLHIGQVSDRCERGQVIREKADQLERQCGRHMW